MLEHNRKEYKIIYKMIFWKNLKKECFNNDLINKDLPNLKKKISIPFIEKIKLMIWNLTVKYDAYKLKLWEFNKEKELF